MLGWRVRARKRDAGRGLGEGLPIALPRWLVSSSSFGGVVVVSLFWILAPWVRDEPAARPLSNILYLLI